jgi:hypothetical protein
MQPTLGCEDHPSQPTHMRLAKNSSKNSVEKSVRRKEHTQICLYKGQLEMHLSLMGLWYFDGVFMSTLWLDPLCGLGPLIASLRGWAFSNVVDVTEVNEVVMDDHSHAFGTLHTDARQLSSMGKCNTPGSTHGTCPLYRGVGPTYVATRLRFYPRFM